MDEVSLLLPQEWLDLAAGLHGLRRLRFGEPPDTALVARLSNLSPGSFSGMSLGADPALWRMVRGGFLYAADAFEAAHEIFQEITTADGSYWHGMLHRREGDFGNAEYWVRRAGRVEALNRLPGFDPVTFIRACARADASTREPEDLLKWQYKEWGALLADLWQKLKPELQSDG